MIGSAAAAATAAVADAKDTSVLPLLLLAILTVDVVVLFLTRYFPGFLGSTLNNWYDRFGLSAVLADVMIIFIGFLIARYVYTAYIQPRVGWRPTWFLALLVVIQLIHDLLFYVGVILPLPTGHNAMIDVFQRYSRAGSKILVGDAMLMLSSALVAFFYIQQPSHIVWLIAAFVLYALPYILYTAW